MGVFEEMDMATKKRDRSGRKLDTKTTATRKAVQAERGARKEARRVAKIEAARPPKEVSEEAPAEETAAVEETVEEIAIVEEAPAEEPSADDSKEE
jgi:hypothetical protein